ncbi:MAG: NAD(P)H-dependent glycerol-3-phosphate dehydrogenase [Pseudomonadota bacterium]
MTRLAILGAGAWGTALAQAAARAGSQVTLWGRDAALMDEIATARCNERYLPGVALEPAIEATAALEAAAEAEALLLVAPAQHTRALAERLAPLIPPSCPLVICAKGIEQGSGLLMSEVLAEALPGRPLAVLSGPTFAAEVARGLPAAITLAAEDQVLAEGLIASLGSRAFRPYLSNDPIGAQIGGAVKNVIAIACGIVAGRSLGDNARAALITRGLAEIVRLGLAKGGQRETLMGLSGLGDLLLTCSAMQSRNFSLGAALGEGRALADILAERRTVAEGVHSASSVSTLAARLQVEMPIVEAVDQVINQGAQIDQTIAGLLARPFKAESL